ncbi:MAG: CYTH domain-containing protein [Candidatus Woesearchaeota archaeon]
MAEEKEVKVRILQEVSVLEVKEKLEQMFHVKFSEPKQDKDVYIDTKDNFYYNHSHALRIRNDKAITYKAIFRIPERKEHPWFVLEVEKKFPVSRTDVEELFRIANIKCEKKLSEKIDAESMKSILRELNFVERVVVEKKRMKANAQDFELCLDEVKDLGLFVEIEAKDVKLLGQFLRSFPFKSEEIRFGYDRLYAQEVLHMPITDFTERFEKDHDWNYLKGQKQLVEELLRSETYVSATRQHNR